MKNPFPARVQGVRPVTKPGSAKETIHVDYSLEGSGLTYTTGDALGVLPNNDPALVDALIEALELDPNAIVTLPNGSNCTLKDALVSTYDITGLKKGTLTKWNAVANSEKLASIIADKDTLKDFIWERSAGSCTRSRNQG